MKRRIPGSVVCLIALAVTAVATGARATTMRRPATTFQFYFTTVRPYEAENGRTVANVWRGTYSSAAGRFGIKTPQPVAYVPNATGIVTMANGQLIVGAFGTRLITVDPTTGRVGSIWAPQRSARVVVDPGGRAVWAIGQSGSLMRIPLAPRSHVETYRLRGPDTELTDIAFDRSGGAFYTAAGGSFGTLDLKRGVTQRLYRYLPAAHRVIFDRYTGDLILTGDDRVTRINPRTAAIVSNLDLATVVNRRAVAHARGRIVCGEASTNDRGSLIVACRTALVFIDLRRGRQSRAAAASSTVVRIKDNVGDIAPAGFASSKRGGCKRHCTHILAFTG